MSDARAGGRRAARRHAPPTHHRSASSWPAGPPTTGCCVATRLRRRCSLPPSTRILVRDRTPCSKALSSPSAQADTLVEAGPQPAHRSLEELRHFASIHPNLSTRAAVCLLGGRDAWVHGTISDVAAVGAEPGDRRTTATARCALVAAGARGVDRTRCRPVRAGGDGDRGGGTIGSSAQDRRGGADRFVQQLLLLLVNGELGSAAESLRPMAMSPGASAALLAGYGLACAEAGAVDAVVEVAALLRQDCRLLVSVGSAWSQVAMCAPEIAAAAGTGCSLSGCGRRWRHRGTGLLCMPPATSARSIAAWACWRRRRVTSQAPERCSLRRSSRSAAAAQRCGNGGRWPIRGSANSELAFVELSFDTTPGGVQQPILDVELLEAALSGRGRDGRAPGSPSWNAGGDGPAWSRRRQPFEADGVERQADRCPTPSCTATPTSRPRRRLPSRGAGHRGPPRSGALALTDHNGFYGVVRFAEAARAVGMPTAFGAEITLTPGLTNDQQVTLLEEDTTTQVATGRVADSHAPDPHGDHLLLLADGPRGVRPARTLSLGTWRGEAPQFTLGDVARNTAGDVGADRLPQGCRPASARRRRSSGRAGSCSG